MAQQTLIGLGYTNTRNYPDGFDRLLKETGQQLARPSLRSPVNGHVKTQLIAHENEVYDIAFSKCTAHGFASVGGDGSGKIIYFVEKVKYYF